MSKYKKYCDWCRLEFPDGVTEVEVRLHTMGHTRVKKPTAYTPEAITEAKGIVEDFEGFVDDFRVILLIHRSKDGATHSNRHERMLFTRDKK